MLKVTRGLPGCGKSTYAKAWVAEDPENRIRVNRDDIRAMAGFWPVGNREQEDLVTKIEEASVRAGLKQGKGVIVDATHLRARHLRRWYDFDADVEVIDFPVAPEECGNRDAERRAKGGASVGRDVIFSMAKQYHIKDDGTLPPLPGPLAKPDTDFPLYTPTGNLAPTFIFDIDGTLAEMDGRGPYDGHLYHTDKVHKPVADMLRHLSKSYTIVVVTGRDEQWRMITEDWLDYHGLLPDIDRVFMRAHDDNRNDAIVKAEILHRDIAPRYDVLGAFDDRDRVVAAWRAMGIKCYQVEPGDF